MIGYYLSSNNEMCYNIKTQTFSPTTQVNFVFWFSRSFNLNVYETENLIDRPTKISQIMIDKNE